VATKAMSAMSKAGTKSIGELATTTINASEADPTAAAETLYEKTFLLPESSASFKTSSKSLVCAPTPRKIPMTTSGINI
jgi:hypothetical protein